MISTKTLELSLNILMQIRIPVAAEDFAEQAADAARAKQELVAELEARKMADKETTDDSTGEHSS